MKLLAISGILFFSVSCSILDHTNFAFTSYDFEKEIPISFSGSDVINKIGNPLQKIVDGKSELFLYRTGYIEFRDQKFLGRGNYSLAYNFEHSFSSNVYPTESLFDVCKRLGLPQNIKSNGSLVSVFYKNGSIIANNNKIVHLIDKLFTESLTFDLSINSFSDFSAKAEGKYLIMPGDKDINPEDLQFREVKAYIEHSLFANNMRVESDFKKADYILLVKYGISDPKEDIKIVSRPVFIPTYVPGQTTNFYAGYKHIGSSSTQSTWGTQYAGQNTETIKTITFNRWLNLEAIDNKILLSNKTMKPVWKVLTNSIGSMGDMRLVLPALGYSVKGFLNNDTQKKLNYSVNSDSLNEYVFDVKFQRHNQTRQVAGKK